ncbi:MFS transporter [Actinomycetospora succinea]|uniref:Multidrug efflux pump Tap n=1 Tax=Actinomycetospora succinea TaxID=663603 RepID=A0A4R6V905_9PSEU|nr:MFS transporter [Actinomycetospora succinea]TDQ55812.1 MFS transporter [Actinomycetospora succinea]
MTGDRTRASSTIFFVSYGLSLLGQGIASVVLPLIVLARTGDVLAAGVLATATTTAAAIAGLVSGLLVDRVDRRWVSIAGDLLAAGTVAALPVVDALVGLTMGWFLVLGVLGAVIRVPGMTARETLLPALARLGPDSLDRLVATRETVGNVLILAGPGLGGLLVAVLGLTPMVMLATATTSLLAALTALVIDPRAGAVPARERQAGSSVRRAVVDLVDAWRFLARQRLVLGATLLTSVLAAVLGALQSTLMPAYFTGEGLAGLTGLTLSAIAGGSIAGSALYAAVAGRLARRTWFVVGMLGTLAGFGAVGSMAAPWVVLAGAVVVGLTYAPAGALLGVVIVEATPDVMRGRVLGAQNTVTLAAPAMTNAPLAAVAAGAGLPVAGLVLAGFVGVAAVLALVAPAFRALDVRATPATPRPDGPDPALLRTTSRPDAPTGAR